MNANSGAPKDKKSQENANGSKPRRGPRQRMRFTERKAQILETAGEFFAENGLTAQTRGLAEKCGISQRLLYRFFPSKEDLLEEVYSSSIVGPFKAVWFAELQDRTRSVEERLQRFYKDYFDAVLTRKWLRLFIYSSLSDVGMAPNYISTIVTQMLEIIMVEAAVERSIELPDEKAAVHEMGWTLHGMVSHYAIRRHLYGASLGIPEDGVLALHIRMFLDGFEPMVRSYNERRS